MKSAKDVMRENEVASFVYGCVVWWLLFSRSATVVWQRRRKEEKEAGEMLLQFPV